MKKQWLCVFMTILCLIVMVPENAFAYENAANRITIINQYDGSWDEVYWKVPCSKSKDLRTAGCGTFALAHAIQWLHNKKMDVHKLVDDMLTLGCHTNTDASIRSDGVNKIKAKYNLEYVDIGSSPSKDKIKSVFDQNGVIVCNIGFDGSGHYILAVGYKEVAGKLYIHMVDSSKASTASRFTAYAFDDLSKKTTSASQYWLTYEQFSGEKAGNKDNAKFRWSGGDHGFALYLNSEAEDFSLVAEIQAVVTTRSDKGIAEYKLQKEPYAAANTDRTVAPGTDLTTTGVYKNKDNEYWLRFTDGTYLCANDVELAFQVESPKSSGLVYPTGDLPLRESFNLEGTITSKSTMPEVWATVYKPNDESFTPVTAKITNVTSVDIYSSALNLSSKGGISFGKLPKGNYCFSLWAYYYLYQDVENALSKPLAMAQVYFLGEKPFTVDGGDEVSQPSGLLGDANDDGRVMLSDIMVVAQYLYRDQNISINLNNADIDKDGAITLSDIMRIANILYKDSD